MKGSDKNLVRVLEITNMMIQLADIGSSEREDRACWDLYGLMRADAIKIRKAVEAEKNRHLFRRHLN